MRRNKKLALAGATVATAMIGLAGTVFACTNYVGDFWVWGNSTGYDTTGTLAVQVIGLQPPNDPSQAMTQTVNSTVAKAKHGTDSLCTGNLGCFKIFTQPTQDSNAYALPSGTYDINTINIGYTNHTTWSNPNGDCMSWRLPSPVTKVGDATVNSSGKITAAHDAGGTSLTVSSNIAGEYKLPTTYVISVSPAEAGVCISDSTSTNGNQAPLTVV